MSDQNGEIPADVPVLGSAVPREDLIDKAVKFLQNSQTRSSSIELKKKFLASKGLTDQEIEEAISRSNVTQQYQVTSHTLPPVNHPVSKWKTLRDYSSMAILIGGFAYAIYKLYKNYIEPVFLKHHTEQKDQIGDLENGVKELNSEVTKSLKSLETVMVEVRNEVRDHADIMERVSTQLARTKTVHDGTSEIAIRELQSQISSLKGLLLNSKQFPAAPVIPSWQIKSKPPPERKSDPENPNNPTTSEIGTKPDPNDNVITEETSYGFNSSDSYNPLNKQINGEAMLTPNPTSLNGDFQSPNPNLTVTSSHPQEMNELDQ
uniref:Peroxisomal membrane protein PEX14 n=1 Tax=Ciona savignyi TaxID=51511 RepID=H2ZD73_CIOSA